MKNINLLEEDIEGLYDWKTNIFFVFLVNTMAIT